MARTARNARVLITGGANGMGLLYAKRAVSEGAARVHLWDRDEAALAAAATELGQLAGPGTVIVPRAIDLSDLDAIPRACEEAGSVDVLVNNAGIVAGGTFWELQDAANEAILTVNLLAPMRIAAHVLPGMIAQAPRPGRILNIASAAGTLAVPQMAAYVASKWGVIGWSESLRLELERAGHGHVTVTTIAPSYVDTGMFDGVTPPKLTPFLQPQAVVDRAWGAMLAGTAFVMMPWTARFATLLRGVLPHAAFDVVAGKGFGVYDSMTYFTGHGGS